MIKGFEPTKLLFILDAFGMVVAILNLIFVGHVPLEPELLGEYYPRTKARIM